MSSPSAPASDLPASDLPTSDLPASDLRARVRAALNHRRALPAFADRAAALRLVDGAADALPRLVVERHADALWLRGPPEWAPQRATLVAALTEALAEVFGEALPAFWRFGHGEAGGPEGDDGARVIEEGGLKFNVVLGNNRNPGLFLDGALARRWVRAHAADRRILNLFSYTCGFGVAALAGGARSTCNVDDAAGALTRGAAHYALNGLPADGRTFWRRDVVKALRQLKGSNARFDGVVLDPPPVRPGGDAAEALEWHLRLLGHARAVVAPGGWLLMLSAAAGSSPAVLTAAAELGEPIWIGGAGPDFRPEPGQPHLVAVAFQAP